MIGVIIGGLLFFVGLLMGLGVQSSRGVTLVFTESLGRSNDLRRLFLDCLIFTVLHSALLLSLMIGVWWISSASLLGLEYLDYIFYAFCLLGAVSNLYAFRLGRSRSGKTILAKVIAAKRGMVGKFWGDVLVGLLMALESLTSNLGVILGLVWLSFRLTDSLQMTLALMIGYGLYIMFMYSMLLSGVNVASLERMRKKNSPTVNFMVAGIGLGVCLLVLAMRLGLVISVW
jgi:hypothetical protein